MSNPTRPSLRVEGPETLPWLRRDDRGSDVITAEGRFIRDVYLATERAAAGKRQLLFEHFAVVRIFYSDVDGLTVEQMVSVTSPLAQDALEIDLLCGAIDGSI